MEALRAATSGASRFLGREKELGTVEAGHTADLVFLSANPLENIANTRKVWAVVRNGSYYDRAALDVMLTRAKGLVAAVSDAKP